MEITSRERKFLIIGAIAIAAIAIYYAVSTTATPGQAGAAGGSVEFKRRELLQRREIVGQEAMYRSRAEQYRQRLQQSRSLFLPGDNASIAGAELQKLLKELADRSGVEIIRRTIQGEQKIQGGIVKVRVNIDTSCQPEQLVAFLAAVENYEKRLVVDELVINSYRIQKRYETRPTLTVSGYILVPETKAEEKKTG